MQILFSLLVDLLPRLSVTHTIIDSPPMSCTELLSFASEQLRNASKHVIDARELTTTPRDAGLTICLHNGTLFYHESHHAHAWHGELDRAYGALQVVNQWLLRTRWLGTACFQHSGRDDQRIISRHRPGTQTLPLMLWHWCNAEPSCSRPISGHEHLSFLWPEHDYEGTISMHQPPTRAFRASLARAKAPPWNMRDDRLRYRGSLDTKGFTGRAILLRCAQNGSNVSAEARRFFAEQTDLSTIDWSYRKINRQKLGGSPLKQGHGTKDMKRPPEHSSPLSTRLSSRSNISSQLPTEVSMPAVTPNMVESSLAAPALPWTHQMQTVPSTLPACGKEGVVVSTCMQTVPSTLPAYMRMENLRLAKHLLWLPGGCYWSSSLNRFMAMGSSLTMPRDFAPSFSLNAFMLLERCGERCVISFNSSGFQRLAICESLSSSFMEHETHTQALARQLAHFVHEQLSPDCVDRYMLALLEGIPQVCRAPSRDWHGCKSVTAHHGVLLSPQVIEHPHAIGASFEQAQSWASLNMSWPRVPVTFLPFECAMYMATHRRLRELPGAALNALHWHGCKK